MKLIIGLLVLGGLALGGMYLFGGYKTLDPTAEGQKAKAAIKTGMTMAQVLSTAGENPKYQGISLQKTKFGEETIVGPPVEFRRERVEKYIKNGEVPQGFNLLYTFSQQVAFSVNFDGSGKVMGPPEDVATMADLLQTRKK
jgi:hypothetical protein